MLVFDKLPAADAEFERLIWPQKVERPNGKQGGYTSNDDAPNGYYLYMNEDGTIHIINNSHGFDDDRHQDDGYLHEVKGTWKPDGTITLTSSVILVNEIPVSFSGLLVVTRHHELLLIHY